jgi:hypothetical protein
MNLKCLEPLFEESIVFSNRDKTASFEEIFIGETEFLPVETLRADEDAYNQEFSNWLQDWSEIQDRRLHQILQFRANTKRFEDLSEAAQTRQFSPFVGSGLSVTSGLPTWSSLLRSIASHLGFGPDKLEEFLERGEYEEAVSALLSSTNERHFLERIDHELRLQKDFAISGPIRLLGGFNVDVVVTTNLDELVERTCGDCENGFDAVVAGSDLARFREMKRKGEKALIKIHGDRVRPYTFVLSREQYEEAYKPGGINR